ncbi:hypothetical protein Dimus_008305 [Dionaea muscipula]
MMLDPILLRHGMLLVVATILEFEKLSYAAGILGREGVDRVLHPHHKEESFHCNTAEQCAFMEAEVCTGDVKDVLGNDPAKRGKCPDLSWQVLIQLETLEEHELAVAKHPRMEEIFGSLADLYGLSALEARKAILGAEQVVGVGSSATVGEVTPETLAGPSAGWRRLRSSSPPIEVVKPEKRRRKGGAPQEKVPEPIEGEREESSESVVLLKDRHRGSKRNVKEVVTKTQAVDRND